MSQTTTLILSKTLKSTHLFHLNGRLIEIPKNSNINKNDIPLSASDYIKLKIANYNKSTQSEAVNALAGNIWLYFSQLPKMDHHDNKLLMIIPLGSAYYPSKATCNYYKVPYFSRKSMSSLINDCVASGLLIKDKSGMKTPGYKKGLAGLYNISVPAFIYLAEIHRHYSASKIN